MNRTKKIAKILTSLQERSIKTKMSKDDQHMTIDVMSRGKDGKKGTGDDKSMRKNKIKVKGDHSPHPVTHKYKSEALELGTNKTTKKYKKDTPGQEVKVTEDKKWHWYNLDRGVYKMQKDNLGRIRGKEMDRKSEVRNGFPNAVEVLSTVKQAAKYAEKKNGLNEASEWEEVFGDETYQDSYWGEYEMVLCCLAAEQIVEPANFLAYKVLSQMCGYH